MALIKLNNRSSEDNAIHGRRNLIINGGFDVWQRGISFTDVNDVYTADRMYVVAGGGTTGDNVTQQTFTVGQTDVPGEPTYFFRFTAGSTSSNKVVSHRIEDVRTGAGQTVTLSFWGKASTAHSSTIELGQNFGSGGSSQVVPASQSYSLTTSWQKFTFNIVLPSISGKTIGTSSYLYISFIRSLPASNVDIDIAQMQLEVGEIATPFEHRSYGEELALCQRYYQEYQACAQEWIYIEGNASTHKWWQNPIKVPMRGTPATTHTGYTGAPFAGTTVFSLTRQGISADRVSWRVTLDASAGSAYDIQHTDGFDGDLIHMDAEL